MVEQWNKTILKNTFKPHLTRGNRLFITKENVTEDPTLVPILELQRQVLTMSSKQYHMVVHNMRTTFSSLVKSDSIASDVDESDLASSQGGSTNSLIGGVDSGHAAERAGDQPGLVSSEWEDDVFIPSKSSNRYMLHVSINDLCRE